MQRNAEWTAYVNQINLADSKIKQGDIVTAENILWRTNPKFRNWEWGRLILNADCSLLTVNLHEKNSYFHSGHVEKASFTHDGKKFLAVGTGGQIKIWDTNSGKLFRKFNSRNEIIRWIDITSDSSKFISSTEEGPVRIWDIQSGKELMQIKMNPKRNRRLLTFLFSKKVTKSQLEPTKELLHYMISKMEPHNTNINSTITDSSLLIFRRMKPKWLPLTITG